MRLSRGWIAVILMFPVVAASSLSFGNQVAARAPAGQKRIAFIVESWYPNSHADVIGSRFLEGYKVGDRTHPSPLTIASVYSVTPRPNDQTRAIAAKYGFRIAQSVAEAVLEGAGGASRPRLAVDGVLIATREDPQERGQAPSPTPRLQVMRELFKIFDQTGTKVPIFLDKMLSANWADAQAIVAEASRRGVPLMAGSVLSYVPLDRPVRSGDIDAAVGMAAGPYWAYAFHAAEFLQAYVELRGVRETGIRSIREVGTGYWSLGDRDRWGGRVFDGLLGGGGVPRGGRNQPSVLLIQYVSGTRAVLALVPRAFGEGEYRLGVQFPNGSTAMGGIALRGEPFDHFGYLVHALAEFYTTGRAPVPVERTLLTTGIVLLGQEAQGQGSLATPSLSITYPASRWKP